MDFSNGILKTLSKQMRSVHVNVSHAQFTLMMINLKVQKSK